METHISPSTKRNWARLGIDGSSRLTKRANKTGSAKRILPIEYITDRDSIAFVRRLTEDTGEGREPHRVLYAVAEALLRERGILQKPHVQKVLREYAPEGSLKPVEGPIPFGERDLLGLLYQSMLSEGQKNRNGSYYTPFGIVSNMTLNLRFSEGQTFLDPCCGSGSFLLALDRAEPGQLWGFESDPTAAMIAKFNLLLKYSDHVFTPQILCLDYLGEEAQAAWKSGWCPEYFDYIATNPPWGAIERERGKASGIPSKESFTHFFVKAFAQLKEGGTIRFLFPEAVLQAGVHRDLRTFFLERCRMEWITLYDRMFSGVSTGFVDIFCKKGQPAEEVRLCDGSGERAVPLSVFRETKSCVFYFPMEEERKVLGKIRQMGRYDLSGSTWALGIVTGDNRRKLKDVCEEGCERIYTGREIERYTMKAARKYLLYDRTGLQQTAREECYRAPEKLVYRFVSNRLVFAYDNSGSLFLNSANILIPRIPQMGIKAVLALLNSDVMQFFYTRIFSGVKVLKSNLEELPFPEITEEQNLCLERLTDRILRGEIGADRVLQETVYSLYGLSEEQVALVRKNIRMMRER